MRSSAANKSPGNDLLRKHRQKRRFRLGVQSSSLRARQELNNKSHPVTDDESETTDVDSEESFSEDSTRHKVFETKRLLDQSHEGNALRQAMRELASTRQLLPPTEAEEQDLDVDVELLSLNSNSTIHSNRTTDSLSAVRKQQDATVYNTCANKALVDRPASNNGLQQNCRIIIDQLSNLVSPDEPMMLFTDDGSHSTQRKQRRTHNLGNPGRGVKFADDYGMALEIIHWTKTMYSEEESDWVRTIVLLLSPKKKKFEFLHVSFSLLDRTPVSDVLTQLPSFASDEALKEQVYVGLVRTNERELINTVCIQSYDLRKHEILVAIVEGNHGKHMLRMGAPLLQNKKIVKAVTRAKSKHISVRKLRAKRVKKKKKSSKSKEDKHGDSPSKVFPVLEEEDYEIEAPPNLSPPRSHTRDDPALSPVRQPERRLSPIPDPLTSSPTRHGDELGLSGRMDYNTKPALESYEETNKDKVNLTRFLNAGIVATILFSFRNKSR